MSTPSLRPPALAVVDWGRTGYRDAWQRQDALVAQRITGEIGDTLVLTEHEPVFTVGLRRGAESHLLWNEARRSKEGVDLVTTNRGGDITYHGPGQIVGYPIVSLDTHRDLHAYLRLLEQVVIDAVEELGVTAGRREGQTGIWVGRRKIAAIGVAVRRWVAYHGFALNVNPDLGHFGGIVPCGIAADDGTVSSLQAELGRPVDIAQVRSALIRQFNRQLPPFVTGTIA